MSPRVLIRKAARRDLADCAAFIALTRPQTAAAFLDSARRTFARLAELPSLGATYAALSPSLRDIRRFRVAEFTDHLIFYRPI
ncbi:MAG: type II toxin-antitoxin system RelE/ParE family toxin, partial [Elusimicrobia bacterium]|nr:type II toxin-antitoxin system RelE/ParE family toxin [Elusimicrobiota bacterium]